MTKLNVTGDALLYSTFFGNTSTNALRHCRGCSRGRPLSPGTTPATASGIAFPTTAGAFQTSAAAGSHAFVTKFNSTGTGLIYSSFLGGSASDAGYGVAVDLSGNSYVTGSTTSSNFPTTAGAYATSFSSANAVAFVTEMNAAGSALKYSTFLGRQRRRSGECHRPR